MAVVSITGIIIFAFYPLRTIHVADAFTGKPIANVNLKLRSFCGDDMGGCDPYARSIKFDLKTNKSGDAIIRAIDSIYFYRLLGSYFEVSLSHPNYAYNKEGNKITPFASGKKDLTINLLPNNMKVFNAEGAWDVAIKDDRVKNWMLRNDNKLCSGLSVKYELPNYEEGIECKDETMMIKINMISGELTNVEFKRTER